MKKILFPLMFLLGVSLFTACNDEDPEDNMPQLGSNQFGNWLQDRSAFVYATDTGDSLMIRYDLLPSSKNIFLKRVIAFSAGTDISNPATVATLKQDSSYVQPGTHFQKPSLWESNNKSMSPREEIYKFDRDFINDTDPVNLNWKFTVSHIAEHNWACSTETGIFAILNTRKIEGLDTLGYVLNNEQVQLERFKIVCESNLSEEDGGGSETVFNTFFVHPQYGLLEASDFYGNYSIVRYLYNLPPM
jgi:hypothetical protein